MILVKRPAKCPECDSNEIQKHGWYNYQNQHTQRYSCKTCGHRFIENPKNYSGQTVSRQICVLDNEMKNLARANKNQALQKNKNDINHLLNFGVHLLKLGLSETTAKTYMSRVKRINKYANLDNPEEVKELIATR